MHSRVMDTRTFIKHTQPNIKRLLPYLSSLRGCHCRFNKGVWRQTRVNHIKLSESGTHVISINQEEKNDAYAD